MGKKRKIINKNKEIKNFTCYFWDLFQFPGEGLVRGEKLKLKLIKIKISVKSEKLGLRGLRIIFSLITTNYLFDNKREKLKLN